MKNTRLILSTIVIVIALCLIGNFRRPFTKTNRIALAKMPVTIIKTMSSMSVNPLFLR